MSAQTAVTQYITAENGVKYAYRRIGDNIDIPLVMHIHYRANMDLWDPLFVNSLAKARQVIIFDNAGVGRSTGEVGITFQEWADSTIAFLKALDLKKIDLMGFSMGGYCVQMVALTAPNLIRKLILSGTSASLPSAQHVAGVVWPREAAPKKPLEALSTAVTREEGMRALEFSFFYDDKRGWAAFDKYWRRVQERTAESLILDLLGRESGADRQMLAAMDSFKSNPRASFDRLGELQMPVLVANGDDDLLIPSSRSWELAKQIPNAQLVIFPKAGHGFLWQYPTLYATYINLFLDGSEYNDLSPKL